MVITMGTNYDIEIAKCKHCGRTNKYHLGKKSFGYRFLIHKTDMYNDIKEFKKFISENGDIYDEYNKKILKQDFIEMVETYQTNKSKNYIYDIYIKLAYNKLIVIDGYDFLEGEFS